MRLARQSKEAEHALALLEAELAPKLAALRRAAHGYANHIGASVAEGRTASFKSHRDSRGWQQAAGWAAFAALCCGAVVVPLSHHRMVVPQQNTPVHAVSMPTDEALLRSVQDDLRSSIPLAMQPLAAPAAPTAAHTQTSSVKRKD